MSVKGATGVTGLGAWVYASRFLCLFLFRIFQKQSKHQFPVDYHVYVWQLPSPLSCGGTFQLRVWVRDLIYVTSDAEKPLHRNWEINYFSKPTPESKLQWLSPKWGYANICWTFFLGYGCFEQAFYCTSNLWNRYNNVSNDGSFPS